MKPTEQELINQIIRANHLACKTLRNTVPENDGQHHEESLEDIESNVMNIDKFRARPSLLADLAPCAMSLINSINSVVLGEEMTKKIQAGIERGIQIENDEQIRILNEIKVDKKDPEIAKLRKSILSMRD